MPPPDRDGFLDRNPKDPVGFSIPVSRTRFYREELARHRRCLEQQREHYSEKAIGDVEAALARFTLQLDRLCEHEHGERLVSRLLHEIDRVTRLSCWSGRKKLH